MKRTNDRTITRRTRTPGAQLQQDELGSVVGGGCCVQGCSNCDLPGLKPLPKFPSFPGGSLPSFP